MEGKELGVPEYFLRIMVPGFQQKLNLPAIISKEVEKQKSRNAVLESRIGTWRINLCKNGVIICLKQGWPLFVERHNLTLGDFVFFKHTGNLHFKVDVFNTNLCENEFCDDEEEKEEDGTQTLIPTKNTTLASGSMFFEKTMVSRHATTMAIVNIPIEFMRWNNVGQLHTNVVLRDSNGSQWPVKLLSENRNGIRFRMHKGWHDFYVSNGLNNGDICVFRLNRRLLNPTTIVFNVQIIRAIL